MRQVIVALVSIAMLGGMMQHAGAAQIESSSQPDPVAVEGLLPADDEVSGLVARQIEGAPEPGDVVIVREGDPSQRFAPRVAIQFVDPSKVSPDQQIHFPQWRVTLGQYVYVYATSENLQFVATLTYAVASSYICGAIGAATTPIGGIACGVFAAAIYYYAERTLIPDGLCYEFRFSYGIGSDGVRTVPRSLC